MRKTLSKQDKLKSQKTIGHVFASGGHLFQYPIKVYYLAETGTPAPVKMGVSVPKKKFKKATDRNLLKRRMREAFRLQRPEEPPLCELFTMWVYIAREKEPYGKIEKATQKLWQQLITIKAEGVNKEEQ